MQNIPEQLDFYYQISDIFRKLLMFWKTVLPLALSVRPGIHWTLSISF